jgi:protein SCO1/2
MRATLKFGLASLATLAAALLAGTVLWQITGGLSSFTSESWRRASVAVQPRALPDALLQDQHGRQFHARELCGKVIVIDFIYTRCPTVCKAQGGVSAQLASRLDTATEAGKAMVLSVSFDPVNDTPEAMARFKHALEPRPTPWIVARPLSGADRQALLQTFGVEVIADGAGGFDHNAALHLVDQSCRLTRILDYDNISGMEKAVRALL